jgi:hypothetical protein
MTQRRRGFVIERVSSDEEGGYRQVAEEVKRDLVLAGLPVIGRDEHAGVCVFVDPFQDGESEGVFVEWRVSSTLMEVFKGCAERRDMSHPAIPFGVSVSAAMKVALKDILEGAGWGVELEAVGVHDSAIKVHAPHGRRRSSWGS